MKLTDKVVIITGAASGIGRAMAILFAKKGAKVVACDVNKMSLGGKGMFFVKTDVRKAKSIKNVVKKIIQKFKKIDILINNAGLYKLSSVEKMSEKDWCNIFDTNLKSAFLFCKEVLPIMRQCKKGVIINMASDLGLYPESESPAYCASKAGLISLTKSLAMAYARHNIRVNAICPGPIDTPLLRRAFSSDKKLREYMKNTAIGRLGRPEEIANVALFLASDDASYVSGAAYAVNAADIV